MKKGILIASRVLLTIVLAFCIFKTCSILADTSIFQITKIEVKEKSEGVVVNDVSLSNGSLNNDIIFSAKDDFVKYNVTIKNTSNDDYIIKSITDNNDSTNLEYTYEDLTNVVVESKTEKTFELQIKYVNEASGLYISNKPVSLTLTYEKKDGSTGSETITNNDGTSSTVTPASDLSEEDEDIVNPNTGDSINKYIIIGLLSMVGLILSITKEKQLFKTLVVVGLFATLAIPFGAKADSEKFVITFTTNKIQNTSTDLISGPELNLLMHKLSLGFDNLSIEYFEDENDPTGNFYSAVNNDYTDQDDEYWIYNGDILAIERATDEEYEAIKDSLTEENIISTSESNNPAYMWFDDSTGTIYYYTPAKALVMNENSSFMFICLTATSNLDLSDFDTINVNNMRGLFYLTGINNLNLGENFDTSNVTDMSFMFSELHVSSLDLGDKFDTSKVTNMSYMFMWAEDLTELNLGAKFDTSNVTDMSLMFADMQNLEELNLGDKFDTSKVTNMTGMFVDMQNLEELDLGDKFDTSKVTNMMGMFAIMPNLEAIYVANDFDLSSLEVGDFMFGDSYSLIGEQGTSYSDICNNECIDDATYARIDDPEHGRPGYFTLGDYSDEIKYTYLISGPEFNLNMIKIASGLDTLEIAYDTPCEDCWIPDYHINDNRYNNDYTDNYIISIERATIRQFNEVRASLTSLNIISTPDSEIPAYMWYEQINDYRGVIYYFTKADLLVMNENSSHMFSNLGSLGTTVDGFYSEFFMPSDFDTSNVTDMSYMFYSDDGIGKLYLGSNFDTSNVTNMRGIFAYTGIDTIDFGSKFNTSKVTDMSGMFKDLYRLEELDLSDFDTSNVTDMSYMFYIDDYETKSKLRSLNLGNNFDTSNVTNMTGMFFIQDKLVSLDLGDKFDTSNVTDMSYMFNNMLNLSELRLGDKFDTSNVTDMSYMFSGMYNLADINLGNKFDTSKVTNMASMFASMSRLAELDLGNKFNTSKVIDINSMFAYSAFETIYVASDFDLSSLNEEYSDAYMFSYDQYLVGGSGTEYDVNHVDSEYARIDDPEHGRPGYFTLGDYSDEIKYTYLISGPEFNLNMLKLASDYDLTIEYNTECSGWCPTDYYVVGNYGGYTDFKIESIKRASRVRYNAVKDSLTSLNLISTSDSDIPAYMWYEQTSEYKGVIYYYTEADVLMLNENSSHMFSNLGGISDIFSFPVNFDTSNVTDMSNMFYSSFNMDKLNLGNNFNTSKVTNMRGMFNYLGSVYQINFGSHFDTSKVTDMSYMFGDLYQIEKLDLSGFDTSSVTDMSYMFNVSDTETKSKLKELNLGNDFDTSNVTNMTGMFFTLNKLVSLDLGDKFSTSKVTNMSNMFNDMNSLIELDLGNKFDTSNVTNMSYMFSFMLDLEAIYVANDFDLTSLENGEDMFYNNYSLVGQNGTAFSYSHTDATYARIDDPTHDKPGYFTLRQN